MSSQSDSEGHEWQVGVWNRMSDVYVREIDQRFVPVIDAVVERAGLTEGKNVLDLGTGTGALAERAAQIVGTAGRVVGVDISSDMLAMAGRRVKDRGLTNMTLREGRGESLPFEDDAFDVVLSSLALMYVIDRGAAAHEIARVLRRGGRLVGAVWAGPEECDIVQFQQTAGRFAGPPPVPGVGPGALADPSSFLQQLADAGIDAEVEVEDLSFEFADFDSAWQALAGVTTAQLEEDQRQAARQAVLEAMYPQGDGPRRFQNRTLFLVGRAVR